MAGGADVVRALVRRAGHELRNAQNTAAVNLEVVRSRFAAGRTDPEAIQSFADNAAKGLDESAELAEAIIALFAALTVGLASGTLLVRERRASGGVVEMKMPADAADRLAAGVAVLADRIRLGVERTATGVILRIPPDHETN